MCFLIFMWFDGMDSSVFTNYAYVVDFDDVTDFSAV